MMAMTHGHGYFCEMCLIGVSGKYSDKSMSLTMVLLAVKTFFHYFSSEMTISHYSADYSAYGTIVFILTIIFVVISNVLLLNILIAMFKYV